MSRIDRYQNPDVYDPLAAAYVLGSLHGRARRRFEQLIDERSYLQHVVSEWQQRLNPLAERLPEVQPRERVWKHIKAEIKTAPSQRSTGQQAVDNTATASIWSSLQFWRGTAFAGMAAAVALIAFQLLPAVQQQPTAAYVAVLESQGNEPMVTATAYMPTRELKLVVMDEGVTPKNQRAALWCVMQSGPKFMLMGELKPGKETTFKLSKKEWQMLKKTQGMAISMEPMDKPAAKEPTGPVMYQGNFVSFI